MNGEKGIVDGQCDGTLGQRFLAAKSSDDVRQGHDVVTARLDLSQMSRELRHRDIGRWIVFLAKAVIHEDNRRRDRFSRLGAPSRQGQIKTTQQ